MELTGKNLKVSLSSGKNTLSMELEDVPDANKLLELIEADAPVTVSLESQQTTLDEDENEN